jgi:hypothetical protein
MLPFPPARIAQEVKDGVARLVSNDGRCVDIVRDLPADRAVAPVRLDAFAEKSPHYRPPQKFGGQDTSGVHPELCELIDGDRPLDPYGFPIYVP